MIALSERKDQDIVLLLPLGTREKQVLKPRREIKQHICNVFFQFPLGKNNYSKLPLSGKFLWEGVQIEYTQERPV